VHGEGNDPFIEHISGKHSELIDAEFKIQIKGEKWSNEMNDYREIPGSVQELEALLNGHIRDKGVFRMGQFRKLSEINDLILISEAATDILFH
jgi:hypothetical protein